MLDVKTIEERIRKKKQGMLRAIVFSRGIVEDESRIDDIHCDLMELEEMLEKICEQNIKNEDDKKTNGLIFADPPYNLSGNGLKWQDNKTGGDWYMLNEQWDMMTVPEYILFIKNWIGIEQNNKYVEIARKRIAEVNQMMSY
ncbi:MAG: site-specific DNA-methyltransferase [Candidatus Magnetominusculus sp. LBB02]|nr:site-specific DNA-methyltransferase [Candidatus Magnetominusculus sp. LBB02]